MSNAEITKFCDEWLGVWIGTSPGKLLSYYSPSAYYQDPEIPDGLKGHAQLLPYFKSFLERYQGWEVKRHEIFLVPEGFFLKWKGVFPGESGNATRFGLDIVQIENGLITRNEVYIDRAAVRPQN